MKSLSVGANDVFVKNSNPIKSVNNFILFLDFF